MLDNVPSWYIMYLKALSRHDATNPVLAVHFSLMVAASFLQQGAAQSAPQI